MKVRPCDFESQSRPAAHLRTRRGSFVPALVCLLCAITLILGSSPTVGADSGHQHDGSDKNISGFQSGVLTANLEDALEIDGKRYRIGQDLVMTDDDGNEQDPGIMRAGDKLHFRLQKGKITQIIWIMPR